MGSVGVERRRRPPGAGPPGRGGAAGRRRGLWALTLLAVLVALVLVAAASVAVGARPIAPGVVFDAIFDPHGSADERLVRELRLPRTGLGIAAGAALGLAGALMQSLTRNPLADPGILGVNAGASAAVVVAIGFAGLQTFTGYVWFALAGAAAVAGLVHLLGAAGPGGATPSGWCSPAWPSPPLSPRSPRRCCS
ncbi:iron chelate uptake ABC transporter family permease subunit [Thermocatellispora tengchongensis]|uniref:iron chelate uptake ABC transporter family permease subunit n=1 Tax=Thermocatellispora tengchongensis TaxID=1073253 RepID=UPI003643A09A